MRRGARREANSCPDGSTRAAIVGAARELFESPGFHNTTVEQIRRHAGVSRASFYFYFPDRTSLFLEVLTDLHSEVMSLRTVPRGDCDAFTRIVLDQTCHLEAWSRYQQTFRDGFALNVTDDNAQQLVRGFRKALRSTSPWYIGADTETDFPSALRPLLDVMVTSLTSNFPVRYFSQHNEINYSNTSFEDAVLAVSEAWYRIIHGKAAPCPYPVEALRAERARAAAVLDENMRARRAIFEQQRGAAASEDR